MCPKLAKTGTEKRFGFHISLPEDEREWDFGQE